MALWFETSVRFRKEIGNGMYKAVTERYLVDALNFAEAEQRTIKEREPYISDDFNIRAVKSTPIAEIFRPEYDRFYLAKVAFITIDEKTGIEKKSVTQILVGGQNFEDAYFALKEGMKKTISDWELQSLCETPILQVYPALQADKRPIE